MSIPGLPFLPTTRPAPATPMPPIPPGPCSCAVCGPVNPCADWGGAGQVSPGRTTPTAQFGSPNVFPTQCF